VARISFKFERDLQQNGIGFIAGVDEAGRGPLAGPVTAAAVMLPDPWFHRGLPRPLRGLNDSKQLTPETRERFFHALRSRDDVRFAVAHVEVETIDAINILQASHQAMNLALAQLAPPPHHVLVDGLRVRTLLFPQTPLVEGDARSFSIAAASVLAKVSRDWRMIEYDRLYPGYGFAEHKGYSTPQHFAALEQYGPCPIHRRSFSPCKPAHPELFNEFD
jgi:ribonuclease HII